MSASGAGGSRVRRLFARAAAADSLAGIIFQGFGAVFLGIGTALASGILTLADLIIIPVGTLAGELGNLVSALIGGGAQIIQIGALTTGLSIGPGGAFNLGPLTFALGIGAVLLGAWVLNRYVSIQSTTNAPIPFLGFDIPYPVLQGPEEEDNE